jgi:predicted MFS family arabinose efflux permease
VIAPVVLQQSSRTTVADLPKPAWKSAIMMSGFGYLWFFGAIAAFNPYIAMYYRSLGFTGLQVGILTAMPAVGLALSGPFWGSVMDALGIHRLVLRLALLLTAIFAIAMANAETFTTVFVFVTALAFSLVPLRALLDSYAVAVSERTGRNFGTIRSWGSIGYFIAVLGLGRIMGKDVDSLFLYAYAGFLLFSLASMWFLPNLAAKQPSHIIDGLRDVQANKPLLLLLLIAFLLMVAYATIYLALGIHMRDSLGGSTTQVGIAFAVGAAAELPAFIWGGRLIRKMGERRLILVVIVSYAVRFLLLWLVTDASWVIAVQAMHMTTFALFLVVSVPLAHKLEGGHHPATTQALLTTTSFGFGNIVGSVGGGALLDHVTTSELFLVVFGLLCVTLLIFVIGSHRLHLDSVIRAANRGQGGVD